MTIYRLSKLAGKYDRNILTPYEKDLCEKETSVFEDYDCITKAVDFCLKFNGEERKVKNGIVENNLQLHAQNDGSFDKWVSLNNLPCDKHIVDHIENGKGIISMEVLNG